MENDRSETLTCTCTAPETEMLQIDEELRTLVVVDLVRTRLQNLNDNTTVRGGDEWKFISQNCLAVVEQFLDEYGIELYPPEVEYIARCLSARQDAYVRHYLFSYV